MSPIEPVWHTFKTIIYARSHPSTSIAKLKAAAQDTWDQITPKNINAYVKHMKDRVKALLAAKGGRTKY